MYLANDVIQNSKKKGPEYGREFGKILKNALTHISDTCSNDEKTIGSLGRILKIWEDRGVYDEKAIVEYRNALNKQSVEVVVEKEPTAAASSPSKRKSGDAVENGRDAAKKQKVTNKEHGKRETIEVDGAVETHVVLSPKVPTGKRNIIICVKCRHIHILSSYWIDFHTVSINNLLCNQQAIHRSLKN